MSLLFGRLSLQLGTMDEPETKPCEPDSARVSGVPLS